MEETIMLTGTPITDPDYRAIAKAYLEGMGFSEVFVRMVKDVPYGKRSIPTKSVTTTAYDPLLQKEVEVMVGISVDGKPLFHL